jgi:aminopeptidase N
VSGRLGRAAAAGLAAALVLAAMTLARGAEGPSSAPPSPEHAGPASAGDYLVPGYGNGGYDVKHYDIDVQYEPATGQLQGTTTITARATERLERFYLDFALPATSVTVNGEPARFTRLRLRRHAPGWELRVVTPSRPLRSGSRMRVVVTYTARPAEVKYQGFTEWNATTTGISVWNEPTAASQWWFPCNCYPSDKATYDVRITAPAGLQALSNGDMVSRTVHGQWAITRWRSTVPMSTYLAFLTIGRYDVRTTTGPHGLPLITAYEKIPRPEMREARRQIGQLPRVLRFLERRWGRYPFPVGGAIVTQTPYDTAFETQTRPIFTASVFARPGPPLWTVVHELSHQWFGDSITASRWRHIWLAEGFATYNEWVWSEHLGRRTAEELFEKTYADHPADDDLWASPVVRPDFAPSPAAYLRGAMTLQALHNRVGAREFRTMMRGWVHSRRHGTASTGDFERYAARVSGQDLSEFFRVWLHAEGRPAATVANGFPPA